MNPSPNFFLTTAGEYKPLEDPRACWIRRSLCDTRHSDHLVIEIRPALRLVDALTPDTSFFILSARQGGNALTNIMSWPVHVYVSHIVDDSLLQSEPFDTNQLDVIAWGRIYPSLESAAQDMRRHAAAVQTTRSPEMVRVQGIRFVREQEGVPERALKDALVKLFEADERIWKAFLAVVDHGPKTALSATLCLRTVMGPDKTLVAKIGDIFASQFHATQHLDILFVDGEQEADLARVCSPFYVRSVSRCV
jgi:hypothetical protein